MRRILYLLGIGALVGCIEIDARRQGHKRGFSDALDREVSRTRSAYAAGTQAAAAVASARMAAHVAEFGCQLAAEIADQGGPSTTAAPDDESTRRDVPFIPPQSRGVDSGE